MSKFWVYIHTCPNGKKYVGCTTQNPPQKRWRAYGGKFREDIMEYGWKNFTHEVFEVGSREEMYRKEVELISFYHSNDPRYGYNTESGGKSGFSYSTEHHARLRDSAQKSHRSDEYRQRMSEAKKGTKRPDLSRGLLWRLPDGSVRVYSKQNACKQVKKGIQLVLVG